MEGTKVSSVPWEFPVLALHTTYLFQRFWTQTAINYTFFDPTNLVNTICVPRPVLSTGAMKKEVFEVCSYGAHGPVRVPNRKLDKAQHM